MVSHRPPLARLVAPFLPWRLPARCACAAPLQPDMPAAPRDMRDMIAGTRDTRDIVTDTRDDRDDLSDTRDDLSDPRFS